MNELKTCTLEPVAEIGISQKEQELTAVLEEINKHIASFQNLVTATDIEPLQQNKPSCYKENVEYNLESAKIILGNIMRLRDLF